MTDRTVKACLIATINGLDLHEGDQGALYVTAAGASTPIGGAWGPAADNTGNWFAWRAGVDPVRVESRDAAIAFATAVEGAA